MHLIRGHIGALMTTAASRIKIAIVRDRVPQIDRARSEVAPIIRDRRALELWSVDFVANVIGRIVPSGLEPPQ